MNKLYVGDNEIGQGDVYSTEETVIGTWIDGRPIYRKTYDTGALTGNSKSIQLNIPNIDLIWSTNISFGISITGNAFPLPYVGSDSQYNVSLYINKSIIHFNPSSQQATASYVTVEYTKTTDKGTEG